MLRQVNMLRYPFRGESVECRFAMNDLIDSAQYFMISYFFDDVKNVSQKRFRHIKAQYIGLRWLVKKRR